MRATAILKIPFSRQVVMETRQQEAISPSLQNLYLCPNLSKTAWEQAHVFLPPSVAQSYQILFAVVENDIENSC